MAASDLCITLKQRARFSFSVTVTNADGSAFDLTNYDDDPNSPKGELKHRFADTTPIATFEFEIPDPTNGEMIVSLDPADTDIDKGGVFDIFIINSTDPDDVRRVCQGKIKVSPSATTP